MLAMYHSTISSICALQAKNRQFEYTQNREIRLQKLGERLRITLRHVSQVYTTQYCIGAGNLATGGCMGRSGHDAENWTVFRAIQPLYGEPDCISFSN